MKIFDTNQAFQWLSFVWGEWDGLEFKRSGPFKTLALLAWSRFWWIFATYDFLRYLTLAVLPPSQHGALEFYLADYGSAIKGKPYTLMLTIGPMYNVWVMLVMFLFNRMMSSDRRYTYWLRYFQIPKTRTPGELKLVGYSTEQLTKFWKFSSSLQTIVLKSLFIQSILTMTLAATSYLILMQKWSGLHSPTVFWAILIINFLSLVSDGTMNLMQSLSPILYFYLNCRILTERFVQIRQKLERLANSKQFKASKIDKCLHDYSTIIDELQRCNHFWKNYLAFNYHLGVAICSSMFLCGLYSDDFFMVCFLAALIFLTYYPALVICFSSSGNCHLAIKAAYPPLTKLLANREISPLTAVHIRRILQFINSQYAGFRCADLFLIKKEITMNVFFSIITFSILLYEMIFFIFNIPT